MDDVTVLVATVVPSSSDSHSNSNPGLDPNSERDELGHASGGEDKQVFWGSAGSISAAVSWSVDSRMQGEATLPSGGPAGSESKPGGEWSW